MRSRRWTGSSGTVVERRSSTIRGSLRTAILRRGESSIGPAARRRCPWDGSGRSDASLTGGTVRYDLASAEVAEWQTRRSQTPLRATSCGFESHLRHHDWQSIGSLSARTLVYTGGHREATRRGNGEPPMDQSWLGGP